MMSFDWIKYLDLAEYVSNNSGTMPDEEACFRTSVSRAYYAAFCMTRKYVKDSYGIEFQDDAHKRIREYLQKIGERSKTKLANKLASQLKDLHVFRKMADYDDHIIREKPRNMAFKSLTMAKKIISEINELENHHVIG